MTGTTDINVNEREGSEDLQIVFSTESSDFCQIMSLVSGTRYFFWDKLEQ